MDRHSTPPPSSVRRRDPTGHLDPTYASDLRTLSLQSVTSDAVMPRLARSRDARIARFAEDFILAATSGDDDQRGTLDRTTEEEAGGPFLETTGRTEFARGADPSNPEGATREPFPTT